MKLLKSPNSWSCLLTSFAMILESEIQFLLDIIGHDGSEIIWPHLKDPLCRKSFHIQELYIAALKLNFTCCHLNFYSKSTPNGKDLKLYDFKNQIEIFMNTGSGVLLGHGLQYPHAVAWYGGKIYDPNGYIYTLNDGMFKPNSFIKIDKI